MPLIRNAEAVGMRQLFKRPVTYLVNGSSHEEFPAFEKWLSDVRTKLTGTHAPIRDVAVIEQGTCKMTDAILPLTKTG